MPSCLKVSVTLGCASLKQRRRWTEICLCRKKGVTLLEISPSFMFVDVLLPLAIPGAYTYRLPASLSEGVSVGSRVLVPLGKKKRYTAIVIRLHEQVECIGVEQLKEVEEVVDERPLLLPQQIELWRWVSHYYMCHPGEVMKAALPSGLKLESETHFSPVSDALVELNDLPTLERSVLLALRQSSLTLEELRKELPQKGIVTAVKGLTEMGLIEVEERVSQGFKSKTEQQYLLAETYRDEAQLNTLLEQLKRAPRQLEALEALLDLSSASTAFALQNMELLQAVSRTKLIDRLGEAGKTSLAALVRRGVLKLQQVEVGRLKHHRAIEGWLQRPLSATQQQAYNEIVAAWKEKNVVLLHGVTSSGKTEIYAQLIARTLAEGKQVLFLLPEIALTTQITQRLGNYFGEKLGVYHSKFPDAERIETWQRQLSPQPYPLILGVRSSLFLPYQNLGLIIVDEEHEGSYKQQDPAPRYHARDLAIVMALQVGARVLLGTATPSLESYTHALSGKYGLVSLTQRFGEVQLPEIVVEDLAELHRKRLMNTPFSPRLKEETTRCFQAGQQAIFFLNRRGYSPSLLCNSCGWTPHCQRCDVSLSFHQKIHRLMCHYCGTAYDVPTHCPQCQQADMKDVGAGTEKIEAAVEACFPDARVGRMDLDTTRSRSAYERIISDFQERRTNLLVGTQMVTKGLDFGGVSLVGILNADQLLNQCDFRAHERAFQMLTQVAGRAGRRGVRGKVVLQTRQAHLPIVQHIVQNDYAAMYQSVMAERKTFGFPPFLRLIGITVKHRKEQLCAMAAESLVQLLRPHFGDDLLGPQRPYVGFVQMFHLRQLLLKVGPQWDGSSVRATLLAARASVIACPELKSASIHFDVDPL